MPVIVGVFDIGYTNFAFAVEKYPNSSINKLKHDYNLLSKNEKLVEQREHSPKLKIILDEFYAKGETMLLELTNLNKGEKCGLQNSTRKNLAEYLNSKKEILNSCNFIILEQQFKTGGACNFDAILLGESTYSWLVFNLDVPISYTPSRSKTCVLGCPRTVMQVNKNGLRSVRDVTKSDRKKWSVNTALNILEKRGDTKHIEYITKRKGDDVSDCILMGLAWILKKYIL